MTSQLLDSNVFHHPTSVRPATDWRSRMIGRPLHTAEAEHQTIGKLVGLAVFSSDALSSVAYGPQELMLILAAAGAGALPLSLPIILAIVALLLILTFSYEQTIHAYPGGGGAYIVARDNLGELPAQAAGGALLTDYVLTVAVSVSSGVAQIVSAYPEIAPYRVALAVSLVATIMFFNLRGVRESGRLFAIPTYFFLVMTFLTVTLGLLRHAAGSLGTVLDPPPLEAAVVAQPLTLLLVLRAFASGTASLTGVEAISNGIMAFKEPRSHNAGRTLLWMSAILGTLLVGSTFLAVHTGAMPSAGETVPSQIARTVFGGRGMLYMGAIWGMTVILVMAANTAFADFPRLGALQAADGFLPRQLTFRGSRLVFSRGIVTLAALASALIVVFRADVTSLIPLYAIGVFLSFSLSQAGMARRWWKSGRLPSGSEVVGVRSVLRHEPGWRHKMAINAVGAACSFVVMLIFAVTKFRDGAWVIVILIPALMAVFVSIHKHYRELAGQLSLSDFDARPAMRRNRVIMPIGGVHRGTLAALRYARTLSDDVTAVYVSSDPEDAGRIEAKWLAWGDGYRLIILDSPYRQLLPPLLEYIESVIGASGPHEMVTVVVPQFVPRRGWTNLLHMRTANLLRHALLHRDDIVIVEVPYQVE